MTVAVRLLCVLVIWLRQSLGRAGLARSRRAAWAAGWLGPALLAAWPASPITVDGAFDDWAVLAPVAPADPAGGMGPVWITCDGGGLCVSLRLPAPPVKDETWGPVFVALDTDSNRLTGFQSPPLGVDYVIQPSASLNGEVMVYKRGPHAADQTWSHWLPPAVIPNAFALGREDPCRVELCVPMSVLEIDPAGGQIIHFRICHESVELRPASGIWSPSLPIAFYTLKGNSIAMSEPENLCKNGGFEQLTEAAARPLPQDWTEVRSGPSASISVAAGAGGMGRSLHLACGDATSVAGMNSAPMRVPRGYVRFQYRIEKAAGKTPNVGLYVIGLESPDGAEMTRTGFVPPSDHVADDKWHEQVLHYDFAAQGLSTVLIAPRVNEQAAKPGGGEWLIDDVAVFADNPGPALKLARIWADKPLLEAGQIVRISAWTENMGTEASGETPIEIDVPNGFMPPAARTVPPIDPGCFERIDWDLTPPAAGRFEITVSLDAGSETQRAGYTLLAVDSLSRYTRQELCTDDNGYWRILPKPRTLQEGNDAQLGTIAYKTSAQIGRNTYGICIHLPREKDYEQPFAPEHLIDDDPETCWSSQQNPSAFPGAPPWVEIDLGRTAKITQINLVPYWRNTDFPRGFTAKAKQPDGKWSQVLRVKNCVQRKDGPRRGDKWVQQFPLAAPATAGAVRIDFDRLPLSGGNYAEVSQGYKARLSGIEVLDGNGRNLALRTVGATVSVSDVFTGWQDTAPAIGRAFGELNGLGVKWVRISQWGDQTEWAAVEREKGQFRMDPVTDAAIRELARNGIDILWTLDYGNHLYSGDRVFIDIGPIFHEGSPFYWNVGPHTDAQRAAFIRYTDYVVRRYKDVVKYWELWNEENGWYPIAPNESSFQPELYGALLYDVAKHIKSIDPTLKVMFGGTAAPAPRTTDIALSQGDASLIDLAAFHPYGIDKPEGGMGTMEQDSTGRNLSQTREQTGWNTLSEIIEGVKEPFRRHGNDSVGVWLNEWGTNVSGLGFTYDPHIGEYACAKYLSRFYIYSGYLAAPAAWWALYSENRSQDWGILDQEDFGLRPMSYALRNLCSVLSDVRPVPSPAHRLDVDMPDPKVVTFVRDGSRETIVAIWAAELSTDDVRTYNGNFRYQPGYKPSRIDIVDLYWGATQEARWSWDGDWAVVDGIELHDYPVVLIGAREGN
jgi:hypothetical protein